LYFTLKTKTLRWVLLTNGLYLIVFRAHPLVVVEQELLELLLVTSLRDLWSRNIWEGREPCIDGEKNGERSKTNPEH